MIVVGEWRNLRLKNKSTSPVFAYHPSYAHPLPDGHRFPMLKYELIPEQLIYEGSITPELLFEPGMPSLSSLLAVHDQSYLDKLFNLSLSKSEERKTGSH